jgi:hypothetical protein
MIRRLIVFIAIRYSVRARPVSAPEGCYVLLGDVSSHPFSLPGFADGIERFKRNAAGRPGSSPVNVL